MNMQAVNTLHKYFIWANSARISFENLLAKKYNEASNEYKGWEIKMSMYMALWYGLLYVVVEGWEKLQLSDINIDQLLAHENKKLLKRYRNGVFHFQKDYDDSRFENFYQEPSTVEWIRNLNSEFSRWFLDNLSPNKHGTKP